MLSEADLKEQYSVRKRSIKLERMNWDNNATFKGQQMRMDAYDSG